MSIEISVIGFGLKWTSKRYFVAKTENLTYCCINNFNSWVTDLDGLRVQSEEGARMGFTGKQVRAKVNFLKSHINRKSTVFGLFILQTGWNSLPKCLAFLSKLTSHGSCLPIEDKKSRLITYANCTAITRLYFEKLFYLLDSDT